MLKDASIYGAGLAELVCCNGHSHENALVDNAVIIWGLFLVYLARIYACVTSLLQL